MKVAYPCKDCPDKKPCCHSRCNKYLEAKRKNNEIREQQIKENGIKSGLNDQYYRSVQKIKKRMR